MSGIDRMRAKQKMLMEQQVDKLIPSREIANDLPAPQNPLVQAAADKVIPPRPHLQASPAPKKKKFHFFRLPHGSKYVSEYNAETQQWTGTLAAKIGDEERVFSGTGNSGENLLRKLGQECNRWATMEK